MPRALVLRSNRRYHMELGDAFNERDAVTPQLVPYHVGLGG